VLFFFCWWRTAYLSLATAEAALWQSETNTHTHTHTHTKHNCTLPSMRNDQNKTETKLAGHRDYFSTANFQTKITATFRGIYGIVRRFWKLSFIHSTISRGTPNHIARSPSWRIPNSNTKIGNAHVVRTQNSTQIYLCTYTNTHTPLKTHICMYKHNTHIYACRRVDRGGDAHAPRQQSPRGGTIKTSNKKMLIF